MSISSDDIRFYGSANMPEDNVSTSGGAIDLTTKVIFSDIATTDNVTVISTSVADTGNITITGRLASGIISAETLGMTGTVRLVAANNYERILKVELASAPSGIITISRDNSPTYSQIATMESGVTTVRRLFYDSSADVSGGSARDYYEKIFVKNVNATLALSNAIVIEQADPSAYTTFDLESSKGGSNSVASRLDTVPSSMLGSFTSANKTIPGGYLGSGEACGIWIKLSLASGVAASKSTITYRITGTST